jgi:hypothetical protein
MRSSPQCRSAPRRKQRSKATGLHFKFGNGNAVHGNKLTIRFDKAGEKRVVDGFVERVRVEILLSHSYDSCDPQIALVTIAKKSPPLTFLYLSRGAASTPLQGLTEDVIRRSIDEGFRVARRGNPLNSWEVALYEGIQESIDEFVDHLT